MPDHKEMGRQPTDRERETTFAPHNDPEKQPDGDPGAKRPRLDHEQSENEDANSGEATGGTAGSRGQWD